MKKNDKNVVKNVVIRADLNLEKWPIFTTRRDQKTGRVLKREYTDRLGNKVIEKVSVGVSTLPDGEVCGPFKTFDYKVLAVLYHLWDIDGRPTDRPVAYSIYQVAKLLNISLGGENLTMIRSSIMRLKNTPIQWQNSYRTGGKSGKMLRSVNQFNILSDIGFLTKREDGVTTDVASTFRFNPLILQNILDMWSKPIILNTVIGLKSDISVILYRHLDLMLALRPRYEITLDKLIDELGMDNSAYPYLSHKRTLLQRAIKEISGRPISTGYINRMEIVPTVDNNNLKLVVTKAATLVTPPESQYLDQPKARKTTAISQRTSQADRISSDYTVDQYIKSIENEEATREHLASWKLAVWRMNYIKEHGNQEPTEEELETQKGMLLMQLPNGEAEWQQHHFGRLLSSEETEIINKIRHKQLDLFEEKK